MGLGTKKNENYRSVFFEIFGLDPPDLLELSRNIFIRVCQELSLDHIIREWAFGRDHVSSYTYVTG
jgi:hypothetical protein